MDPTILLSIVAALFVFALGGVAFAFVGNSDKTKKRMAQVSSARGSPHAVKGADTGQQQRRKNMQVMLKELEKQQAEQRKRPTLRRRIEMAGLSITVRTYWTLCGAMALIAGIVMVATGQQLLAAILVPFVAGLGLPYWVLSFLKNRREKAFTREFANAIDIIVRSVKAGLPVNEALKVVASEIPDPVGNEFRLLCEGQKVGVSLDDGLKRMYERMPTAEVNFFGIVMTIQQKSGGNLSEALQNLTGVLRDRKRIQQKIKAMSSEAKASAGIIGSLPPGVGLLVYITTPSYMSLLVEREIGHLMIMACAFWMGCGLFVMKKMCSFKF